LTSFPESSYASCEYGPCTAGECLDCGKTMCIDNDPHLSLSEKVFKMALFRMLHDKHQVKWFKKRR
jgi:hypothetical protein